MTVHKVRMIDGDDDVRFGRFMPEHMDPRNAESPAIRDGMIAMRQKAGLPDFPERPLYPDREVHFEPEAGPSARPGMVAQ